MPRISVKNDKVEERHLDGGKIIRSQRAQLELGDGYALPFRVGLGTRPAYPVGTYDVDPRSFKTSDYGDLMLARYVDLVPFEQPRPAAAAPAAKA